MLNYLGFRNFPHCDLEDMLCCPISCCSGLLIALHSALYLPIGNIQQNKKTVSEEVSEIIPSTQRISISVTWQVTTDTFAIVFLEWVWGTSGVPSQDELNLNYATKSLSNWCGMCILFPH